MQLFVVVAALLQVALCGHVSVRMPYLNPAGVTYVNGFQDAAPLSYAPGAQLQQVAAPLQYAAPQQYAAHFAPQQYAAHFAPQQYAAQVAPLQYAAHAAVPAKVEAHHVGYATAQVPAVAAVPYVKHVPTVSHVPVTRIEAQHAVFEKQLDVVKPAVSTRKVEVRRPAIQKQFYDIEERVIIRPAGSAVVELDEPTSKLQKGPAVVQPLVHNPQLAYQFSAGHLPVAPVLAHAPIAHPTGSPLFVPSSTPEPSVVSSTPSPNYEDESVVVENPDFRNIAAGQNQAGNPEPQVVTRSNGAPLTPDGRFAAHDPSPAVISSQRTTPEENKNNQNRLIELLTARGGVTEVGFGRDGSSNPSIGDAGHVRARVLSATPAPDNAEPSGERVSTRRVVVSRPIETLQEYDLVEPATKIERVSVQQPTLIKTARLEHVQVHGSVPVVGKALAPAVAHAAVPVYQKTISPAYEYYH